MAERYTRLFMLQDNDLYETGSPILLCAGALLKDTQTGKSIVQLKFRNISMKQIAALKVSLRAFDAFGTETEGVPEFQYLDLSVTRDQEFGQKTPIVLPNAETRSFISTCKGVIFADGTKWEPDTDEWIPLKKQKCLKERFGALAAQYRRDTGLKTAAYIVTEDRDLWLCACGAVNRGEEVTCHACKVNRIMLQEAEDTEKLKEHNEVYHRCLAEQKEEKRKAERNKVLTIILSVLLASVVAVFVLITAASPEKNGLARLQRNFGVIRDLKLLNCSDHKYEKDFSDVFGFSFRMTKEDVIRYESEKYGNTVYEFTPNVNDKEDRLWFEPSEFQGKKKWRHLYFFDKETGLLDAVRFHNAYFSSSKQIECQHIDRYVTKILSIIGKWDKVDLHIHETYGIIENIKCSIVFEDSDYLYRLDIRSKE